MNPSNSSAKWRVLAVVQLGVLLCALDTTVVLFALPSLALEFDLSIAAVQWVSVAYTLTCAAFLPLAGKLADRIGRKPAYLLGFSLFTFASALSAWAPGFPFLVGMRAVTALGAAFLLSSSSVITSAVFPKEQRALALGINTTVHSVGFALGISLGAFILHVASWPWIFLLNVPIGIVALVAGARILDPAMLGRGHLRGPSPDFAGAATLFIALAALLLGAHVLADGPAGGGSILLGIAVAAAGLWLFLERRAEDPVLPLSFFQVPVLRTGAETRALMRMATAGLAFTMPFYLQRNLGLSPGHAGLVLFSNVMVSALAGPAAGHAAYRWGARRVITLGLIILCAGTCLHLLLPGGTARPSWDVLAVVALAQGLLGLGGAMFGAPNTNTVLQAVPADQRGVASGLLWTMAFLGQSFGASLAALLLHMRSTGSGPLYGQESVFLTFAILLAAAAVLSYRQKALTSLPPEETSHG